MNAGLFLAKVDDTLQKTIDLTALAAQFSHLPVVKIIDDILSAPAQKEIREDISSHGLNSVILAGLSPLYYKRVRNAEKILTLIQDAGVNPNKIVLVNLREQVAMPHRAEPLEATRKAGVLIEVALQKIRMSRDVERIGVTPKKHVLIIGTTVGGLFAGQRLAEKEFQVHVLVPSVQDLTQNIPESVRPTLASLQNSRNVRFYDSSIDDLYGYPGNFRIHLKNGKKIRAGAIIVAIPGDLSLTEELYPFLRLERDEQGFFTNLASETATVETAQDGIYMIRSDNGVPASAMLSLADSANTAVHRLLDHGDIQHELFVSEVDSKTCGGCGTCIKTCIFRAADLDPVTKLSSTNFKRCVGCGNCVSACPTGARDQVSATTQYLISAIDILSRYRTGSGPKILFIGCEGCGYPCLDYAARQGIEYPTNLLPLSVKCAGRIDTQLILEAFQSGFDGVAISRCKDNHCLNIVGNLDMDRRSNLFRTVLRSRGIDPERLRIFGTVECEGSHCVSDAMTFIEHLKEMGGGMS